MASVPSALEEHEVGNYVHDCAWHAEGERLKLLERWCDPETIRHLETLGVGQEWTCLEIGAGAGSIARWLSDRVGPEGHVIATDLDTRFVEAFKGPNLEVRQHDVRCEDFPAQSFDLIHTRALLFHLPDRVAVMQRLVAWLKPGGWLLVEEADCYAGLASTDPLWAKFWLAYDAIPLVDARCGRLLPRQVQALGLEEVDLDINVGIVRGGTELATWHQLTCESLRPTLVATGEISDTELDEVCSALDRREFLEPGFVVVAVSGRRAEL